MDGFCRLQADFQDCVRFCSKYETFFASQDRKCGGEETVSRAMRRASFGLRKNVAV